MRKFFIKQKGTLALLVALALVVGFSAVGCSRGTTTTPSTTKTPVQVLNESTQASFSQFGDSLAKLATRVTQVEGKVAPDLSPITSRLTTLETQFAALNASVRAQIESAKAQIVAEVIASIGNSSIGSTSSKLSLSVLGGMPVIVNDGLYLFTVRVTNGGSATATGNIVLQLTAKSGMTTVSAAAVVSDSVTWKEAQIKPTASSSNSITIVSDQIYLIGGSSSIYQFTLSLAQNGAFEWTPTLTVTQ
jgi:hypothetical protein